MNVSIQTTPPPSIELELEKKDGPKPRLVCCNTKGRTPRTSMRSSRLTVRQPLHYGASRITDGPLSAGLGIDVANMAMAAPPGSPGGGQPLNAVDSCDSALMTYLHSFKVGFPPGVPLVLRGSDRIRSVLSGHLRGRG
jgi:hypothetical protein